MTMPWGEERYVRVYTRKTPEWLALNWQAKACWPLVLSNCDRAGVLQVPEGERRIRTLAGALGLPTEVVAPGIADLLVDGCVVERPIGYVVPNFIEAQEAKASDRQRQRDSRERRRDFAIHGIEHETQPTPRFSRDVTKRDEPPAGSSKTLREPSHETQRDVTERDGMSRNATKRHETGENVTPYRTVPSFKATGAPGFSKPVVLVGGRSKKKNSSNFLTKPANQPDQLRRGDHVGAWESALVRMRGAGKRYAAEWLGEHCWPLQLVGDNLEVGVGAEATLQSFDQFELLLLEALEGVAVHPKVQARPWTREECMRVLQRAGLTGTTTSENFERFWLDAEREGFDSVLFAAQKFRSDAHWAPEWPVAKFICEKVWRSRLPGVDRATGRP